MLDMDIPLNAGCLVPLHSKYDFPPSEFSNVFQNSSDSEKVFAITFKDGGRMWRERFDISTYCRRRPESFSGRGS